MKTILLTLLCICSLSAFGQSEKITVEPDARLMEVYAQDYLTQLQTDNPFLIQRWNFYLDNAYTVSENFKNGDYPFIQIDDLNNINILLLEKEQKLTHDFKAKTCYRIAGTNKVLIYRSGSEFAADLNAHLGRVYPK